MTPGHVTAIGVPLDLGQSRRGVDMGPSAIRYAGLFKRLSTLIENIEDGGDIAVPVREHLPQDSAPPFTDAIARVCERVYAAGVDAIGSGTFPLFLGGDHSIAVGTIGGIASVRSTGVLWFDAHGDFNIPETSPNGNIHGMPVSILLGFGDPMLTNLIRPGPKLEASDIVLIGTRDLDFDERTMLRQSGIRIYTMREIDERGIGAVTREALGLLSAAERLHVSFDVDVLDPQLAPGVGTPSPGGLTYREANLAMEIVAESGRAGSMDVVEINPILDHGNVTAQIAVDVIASLLGERIL